MTENETLRKEPSKNLLPKRKTLRRALCDGCGMVRSTRKSHN